MKRILCIIPTKGYGKTLDALLQCIDSIDEAASKSKEVVVSITIVTEHIDVKSHVVTNLSITYIHVNNSVGYGERNNLALNSVLKKKKCDFVLLLNDDATITSDFFIQSLPIFDKTNADLLGGIVYEKNSEEIDSYGSEYFSSGYAKNAYDTQIETTLLTGACMMCKVSFLVKMQEVYGYIFNPIFYYYIEDVEFCIRALAIKGKLVKSEKLVIRHYGSYTSGKKTFFPMFYTFRNILWVLFINWPVKTIIRHSLSILTIQLWVIVYSSYLFGPVLYIKILWETFKHRKKLLAYRRTTQLGYAIDFNFEEIFSTYAFRTHHGLTLRI